MILTAKDSFVDLSVTSYDVDPLVLAVALHRTGAEYGLSSMTKNVTDADRELAAKIKSHFTKKFLWKSLKKPAITDYQTNTLRLLDLKGKWEITDKEAGLFVKLPWFYEEDLLYKTFPSLYKTQRSDYDPNTFSVTTKLTLSRTSLKWRGSKKYKIFWFTCPENKLYGYTVPLDNPLLPFFEASIQSLPELTVNKRVDNMYGVFYNRITKFNLQG